jgi:uncharacterized protein (DUF1778 family)
VAAEPSPREPAVPARQRPRLHPARSARVFLRLSTDEHEDLVAAAGRAGLTPTGFAAQAALAAARGQEPPAAVLLREALAEVMTARTQVRRFATNVNQAVAALHSVGQPPEWLGQAVELTTRATQRLDEAAQQLSRRLS